MTEAAPAHRNRATSSEVSRWSLRAAVRLGLAVDEVGRRTAELGHLVDQVLHRPGGARRWLPGFDLDGPALFDEARVPVQGYDA